MTLAGGQRKFNRSAAPFAERQAHFARWLLLGGWCFLIVSLLVPWWDFWPVHLHPCSGQPYCHRQEGTQIFWGSVVPLSVLMLVVHSHELWRRLCPLAFVSRLAGSLGLQRHSRSGRRPARVEASSWLGRHHVQLQWSLFIAGLSLRLLMLNNTPQLLGLFLGFTLVAAALVGWAYEGKAWCQFVCPMAPVQSVLTGPRSLLGSSEAGLSRTRFPESMCIILHPQGEERRGCTGCIRPCIDISATDTYWHDLSGKRGLQFAWTSYLGLVMGFFLLMLEQLHDRLDHVRSGLWAYRSDSLELLYTPLHHDSLLHLPRLVSLPALLVLSGCLSTGCFLVVQALMARRLRRYLAAADARRLARHRTRLLATFTAVNVFFFFSDPSLGALWGAIGWAVRLLVGGVSLHWLRRHWSAALPSGRRISVAAGSWSDAAGNLGEAAPSAEITYDTLPAALPPTLTILTDSAVLYIGQITSIAFIFSGAPVGFTAEAITAVGGVISDLIETSDPAIYLATFTPDAASNGIAVISVAAGSYTNAAGQPGEAATSAEITYDTLPPTLAITSDTTVLIAGQVASISFFFSKLPVGFAAEAITAVGGVISDLSKTADPAVFTATFTPDAASSGIALISVAAGSYSDAAGNIGEAASSAEITYDTLPLTNNTIDVLPFAAAITNGFAINAGSTNEQRGFNIADAGDVSGDGLADLIVFSPLNDPSEDKDAWRASVLFSKASTESIDFTSIAAGISGGFAISGGSTNEQSGYTISDTGDVNGDGLADLIISSPLSDPSEETDTWRDSVLFGKASTNTIDLTSIAATISGGFAISSGSTNEQSGYNISDTGDVDGDGLSDLIVSPPLSDPSEDPDARRDSVVFGKASTASLLQPPG